MWKSNGSKMARVNISDVAREAGALFPAVATVSLALTAQASADTATLRRLPSAIVGLRRGSALSAADSRRMAEWMQRRLGVDTLVLVTTAAPR